MLFHFGFDLVLMSIPLFVTAAPGLGWIGRSCRHLRAADDRAGRPAAAGRTAGRPAGRRAQRRGRARPRPGGGAGGRALDAVEATAPRPARPHHTNAARWTRATRLLALFGVVGFAGLGLRSGPSMRRPRRVPQRRSRSRSARGRARLALRTRAGIARQGRRRARRGVALRVARRRRRALRPAGRRTVDRRTGRCASRGSTATSRSATAWRVVGRRRPRAARRRAGDRARRTRDAARQAAGRDRGAHDRRSARSPLAEAAAARLRAVSAQAAEQPARIDWLFTYADPAVALPAGGEARIASRSTATRSRSSARSLFVPDAWKRDAAPPRTTPRIPRRLLDSSLSAFAIAGWCRSSARLAAARRRSAPRGSRPR